MFKLLASKFFPGIVDKVKAKRNRDLFKRKYSTLHALVRDSLYKEGDITVLSGPFKGMRYFDEIVWGSITPRWTGSYEKELHGIIENIPNRKYDVIIDVGCAEGYYAVGLAFQNPKTKVYAFDTDYISRAQVRRLSKLNDVADRVIVKGYCSYADITNLSEARRTLIICDIEGFERSLLDPFHCAQLRQCDILVETHQNHRKPSTISLLRKRFSHTHSIEIIEAVNRRNDKVSGIPPEIMYTALDESRTDGREWMWMLNLQNQDRREGN